MSRPGPDKVGAFVRQQRDELTRIWRLARAAARPEVFPGLLDGVIAAFFEACGDRVGAGGDPQDVWRALVGLIRWPPALAPGELGEEWSIAVEVLSAACESMSADPAATAWLESAARACQAGTASMAAGREPLPPGLVTALVYSPVTPRRTHPENGTNA